LEKTVRGEGGFGSTGGHNGLQPTSIDIKKRKYDNVNPEQSSS
jgi:hypothetical protein